MTKEEQQRVGLYADLKSSVPTAAGSLGASHQKPLDPAQYPSYMFGLSPNKSPEIIYAWGKREVGRKIYWTVWAYAEKGTGGKSAERLAEDLIEAAKQAIFAADSNLNAVAKSIKDLGYVKPVIELIAGSSVHRRGFEIETFQ